MFALGVCSQLLPHPVEKTANLEPEQEVATSSRHTVYHLGSLFFFFDSYNVKVKLPLRIFAPLDSLIIQDNNLFFFDFLLINNQKLWIVLMRTLKLS